MEKRISFSAVLNEEELGGNTVFVAECLEFGVSDFGSSVDESLSNLKNGISLLLEEAPEKKELLLKMKFSE